MLLEDLRRDFIYGSILRVVALGVHKPSAIARAIGKNSAQDVAPARSLVTRGLDPGCSRSQPRRSHSGSC